jgi:hypothetical protein
VVWIDDELTHAAHAWAAGRTPPARLIDVDPAIGLTEEIVMMIATLMLDEQPNLQNLPTPNPQIRAKR